MHKRYLLGSYRLFFGLLTLAAVVVQLVHQIPKGSFVVSNFFSFFTIQSNLLATALLLYLAFKTFRGQSSNFITSVRGAITLYMLLTGIIYALLLSGLQRDLQTTIPWVNTVVHYLMPVVILVDWLIDLPRNKVAFKKALLWLIYPVTYVTYSLIRGHITGWYPYPFLNPLKHGYLQVGITCVVMAAGFVGLSWVVAHTTRLRHI